MIKKYLVCGKKMYLQSKLLEQYSEQGNVIELYMPIQEFWDVEKELKQADYLLATGEAQAEVVGHYRKIYGLCAPWAIYERDRTWLYKSAGKLPLAKQE